MMLWILHGLQNVKYLHGLYGFKGVCYMDYKMLMILHGLHDVKDGTHILCYLKKDSLHVFHYNITYKICVIYYI